MRAVRIGLILAVCATSWGAIAQPAAESNWIATPTPQNFAAVYPRAAVALTIRGRATIACSVDDQGRLTDCTAPVESPQGFGFGDAALRLARYFRLRPDASDRTADGGVRIPIRFELPASSALPNEPAAASSPTPESLAVARKVLAALEFEAELKTQLSNRLNAFAPKTGLDPQIAKAAALAMKEAFNAETNSWTEQAVVAIASQSSLAALEARVIMDEMSPPLAAPDIESLRWNRVIYMRQMHHKQFCALRPCEFDAEVLRRARNADVPPYLRHPEWVAQPTPAQIAAQRPSLGRMFSVSGAALMACRVTTVGAITNCAVRAESPAGLGFGAAALELEPLYRLAPSLLGQEAPGKPVDIAVVFNIPGESAGPPPQVTTEHERRALALLRLFEPEFLPPESLGRLQAVTRADRTQGVDPAAREAAAQALGEAFALNARITQEASAVALARDLSEPQLRSLLFHARSEAGRQAIADRPRIDKALDIVAVRKRRVIEDRARATVCAAFACEPEVLPKSPAPTP